MISHGPDFIFPNLSSCLIIRDSEPAVALKAAALKTVGTGPVKEVWVLLQLCLLTLLFSLISPVWVPLNATFVEIQRLEKILFSLIVMLLGLWFYIPQIKYF